MTESVATPRRLERSRSDRMIAGVCGGLGRYFDVNPVFYRVGFVVLALLGGAGVLIYAAAVLVIPGESSDDSIAAQALRDHRERPWAMLGLVLFAVAAVVLASHAIFWPHGNGPWLLLLLGGAALLWAQRREGRPPTTPGEPGAPPPAVGPRPASLVLPVLGALVVGAGILALLQSTGVAIAWDLVLAFAATGVGLVVVIGALLRLRVAALVFVGLALGFAAIAVSAIDVRLDGGIGDRTYSPATSDALEREYRLGIGELHVDLSDIDVNETTRVNAYVGIGQLVVTVSDDVAVRVESEVSWGEFDVFGEHGDGRNNGITTLEGPEDGPLLIVHAEVGLGEVEVRRAVE